MDGIAAVLILATVTAVFFLFGKVIARLIVSVNDQTRESIRNYEMLRAKIEKDKAEYFPSKEQVQRNKLHKEIDDIIKKQETEHKQAIANFDKELFEALEFKKALQNKEYQQARMRESCIRHGIIPRGS